MIFHRRRHVLDEFAVLGAFVLVSTIGLLYGGLLLFLAATAEPAAYVIEAVQPPLVEEYRRDARVSVGPFFDEVLAAGLVEVDAARFGDPGSGPGSGSALAASAEKAKADLLVLRVPGEERETHLSLVLLLEQWRRALAGSVADQDTVLERTHRLLQEHPWMSAGELER